MAHTRCASRNDDAEKQSPSDAHKSHYINVHTLEDRPKGYPPLSVFMASDQNMMQYRAFRAVHVRLLLHLQTDIQYLENELSSYDEADIGEPRLCSWAIDAAKCQKEHGVDDRTRREILEDLRIKILQYDELLIHANAINGLQNPTELDYNSLRSYMSGHQPLVPAEEDAFAWKGDMITLRHNKEGSAIEDILSVMLRKYDCRFLRWLYGPEEGKTSTGDPSVFYFSASKMRKTVNMFIAGVILLLLAAPILGMYKLSTMNTERTTYAALGVLMAFSLIFAATMSLLTKAQRHEVFAATAAYCAVLIVFVGSQTN